MIVVESAVVRYDSGRRNADGLLVGLAHLLVASDDESLWVRGHVLGLLFQDLLSEVLSFHILRLLDLNLISKLLRDVHNHLIIVRYPHIRLIFNWSSLSHRFFGNSFGIGLSRYNTSAHSLGFLLSFSITFLTLS